MGSLAITIALTRALDAAPTPVTSRPCFCAPAHISASRPFGTNKDSKSEPVVFVWVSKVSKSSNLAPASASFFQARRRASEFTDVRARRVAVGASRRPLPSGRVASKAARLLRVNYFKRLTTFYGPATTASSVPRGRTVPFLSAIHDGTRVRLLKKY